MKTYLRKTALCGVLIILSLSAHAFTAVTSGSWSNAATWGGVGPGGTVTNQDIIIPTGVTVTLDMDVMFDGAANTFSVNGTLSNSTNFGVTLMQGSLNGAGSISIRRLVLNGTTIGNNFTGNWTLSVLKNSGATLALMSAMTITDTLNLDSGSVVLSTGSTLTMGNNSVIKVNDGTLSSQGGTFVAAQPYDVWYVGLSKTTGLELRSNTLRDLHVNLDDNSKLVIVSDSVMTNGTLYVTMGHFNFNGASVTIGGDVQIASAGILTSNFNSDLYIDGAGVMTSSLKFTGGSGLHNLTIDRANTGTRIATPLYIYGTVHLLNGDLYVETGGNLIMAANSMFHIDQNNFALNGGSFTANNSYDVMYTGPSHTGGVELSGATLNNVTIDMATSGSVLTLDTDVVIYGQLSMLQGNIAFNGYDLTLDGSINQMSTTTFIADSTSKLTLNLTSLSNDTLFFNDATLNTSKMGSVIVNLPATGKIYLGTILRIDDSLDINSGKLVIGDYNVIVRDSAVIHGGNNNSYIVTAGNGVLYQWIVANTPFRLYPIGTMTEYSPVYLIQDSVASSGYFASRVLNGAYTQGLTGTDFSTYAAAVNKTWDMQYVGPLTMNLIAKFGWPTTSEVNGFNRNSSYVSNYNLGWDSYAISSAMSGPFGTYESSRYNFNSLVLGPFIVADASVPLNVPTAPVSDFNVFPNPASSSVTVEIENPGFAMHEYTLFDMTGKQVMTMQSMRAVNDLNISGIENGVYYLRITNLNDHSVMTKRVVKD